MEGLAYSFLCEACRYQHDPGLTCRQATFIRMGRCEKCGRVHGDLSCSGADEILRRFCRAPSRAGEPC